MDWFYAALIAVFGLSIASLVEKPLASHLFPSPRALNNAFGLVSILRAALYLIPVALTIGFQGGSGVIWAITGGVFFGLGISLYFHALKTEEVSRAVTIASIAPVFIVLLVVVILGESVTLVQLLGIGAVVFGVASIGFKPGSGKIVLIDKKPFFILILSTFSIALAFIFVDEATNRMNVYATEGFRCLGMSIGVLATHWTPKQTKPLIIALKKPKVMALTLFSEGILTNVSALALVYALSVGPVSLVGATFAIWPFVVLVLSISLSTRFLNILNEPLDRSTLGFKLIATLFVVVGIVALRL